MPNIRYEQINQTSGDVDMDGHVSSKAPVGRCNEVCIKRCIKSLLLIGLYFALSIGLTFYQRWLLQEIRFPLSIVIYHLVIKFTLSALIRGMLYFYTGTPRVSLPFMTTIRNVAPTGLASGIDVGFSNWGLGLVTVSLYTMTKSTTIIFILLFAILLGLEKKSCSLVMIVVMISTGLSMFTYKATQFNLTGFILLILASLASGLRWSFAQVLMQKSKLGLHNPLDIVYYVQPWMLLSVLPFAISFEGLDLIHNIVTLPNELIIPYACKVSFGAFLAFAMELSEYLVVTYTSSLTLSVAGIFKEVGILVLAVKITGDQMSLINVLGLVVCLIGISGHILHKFLTANSGSQNQSTTINYSTRFDDDFIVKETLDTMKGFDNRDISVFRRNTNKIKTEHTVPLLADDDDNQSVVSGHDSMLMLGSDDDSNRMILDILQRRDIVR